ncbi:hypothetical protein HK097_003383 [Rhizophlyctis rosea]|uniref:Uncharacterized protein n=1 Tax=Rhizophlyctis rosea TaxID=64517 RepID=A0AAD5S331_9FUNG|nr:hypothetical protein HK097_003383 [Rhizophlyctis rosea]
MAADSPRTSRGGSPENEGNKESSRLSTPLSAIGEMLVTPGAGEKSLVETLASLGFTNPTLPCSPNDLKASAGWETLKETFPIRYLHFEELTSSEKSKVNKFCLANTNKFRKDPRLPAIIHKLSTLRTYRRVVTKDEVETASLVDEGVFEDGLMGMLPLERTLSALMLIPFSCMLGGKEGLPDVAFYLKDPSVKQSSAQPGRKTVRSRDFLIPFMVGEHKDGEVSAYYASPQAAWAQVSAALMQLAVGFDVEDVVIPGFMFAGPAYGTQVLFLERRVMGGEVLLGFVVAELDTCRMMGTKEGAEDIALSLCGMIDHYRTVQDVVGRLVASNCLRTIKAAAEMRVDEGDGPGGSSQLSILNTLQEASSPIAQKHVLMGSVIDRLEVLAQNSP